MSTRPDRMRESPMSVHAHNATNQACPHGWTSASVAQASVSIPNRLRESPRDRTEGSRSAARTVPMDVTSGRRVGVMSSYVPLGTRRQSVSHSNTAATCARLHRLAFDTWRPACPSVLHERAQYE